MNGLAPLLLGLIFLLSACAIWIAGVKLSNTTAVLSTRLGMGEALGGLILLALATNLPEVAITASAALSHNLGIAIGNILGGIAIQTVVLVLLDAIGVKGDRPLTYRAASLQLVLEAALVIAVLMVAVAGTQLPKTLIFLRMGPAGLLIATLWIGGLILLKRAGAGLPWHESGQPPDSQQPPRGHAAVQKEKAATDSNLSSTKAGLVFAGAAVVTLIAGVLLERSGEALSSHLGLSGVLFGATVLAAATSLPEVSTGLTSVRLGDYQLAMSDIFGGNAFLPVLFLAASIISGTAVLPQAQNTDIYLTALGALLTAIYLVGLIFRPSRRFARMGPDSLAVLTLYGAGIVGLIAISRS